jgi:rhamnose transport system ATP-binding protein
MSPEVPSRENVPLSMGGEGTGTFIELEGVGKRFGGVTALDGIDLRIEAGGIHALVGENGAGKSTLGRIIAGAITADTGTVSVFGETVSFSSPREALRHGIGRMDQELMIVPGMTVLENVLLGDEPRRGTIFLGRDAARQRFAELSELVGADLEPNKRAGTLSVAQRQMVEFMRALARDVNLLVMDEPTAPLTQSESERMYEVIRKLRSWGTTIVYVSHFLDEVLELSDTVTVLRDGRLVRTAPAAAETEASLIKAMIGRDLDSMSPRAPRPAHAPVVLSASHVSAGVCVRDASFSVRAGEIVGLFGLIGSGRTELARAVFGADRIEEGTVTLEGKQITGVAPRAAIQQGVALLPEDRRGQGLCLQRSIAENLTLPHASRFTPRGLVNRGRVRRAANEIIERLDIRPADAEVDVGTLSGGNQQKVLLGKWLIGAPKVLIVDEPTRGVDVGAKRTIHELLVNAAAAGLALVLISSEIEEVLGLAHRILVMREGRLVAEFDAASVEKEQVLMAAFGSEDGLDTAAFTGDAV